MKKCSIIEESSIMEASFGNIRIGQKYTLINFGETFQFIVQARRGEKDYVLKDIHTLELFYLSDILKYGKGKDYKFEIIEKDQ